MAECLKGIPKPDDFDWVVKMNTNDRRNACQEEQEQDVGLQQDPRLPSPSAEPIPLGQGCSRQKFEPWSCQLEPSDQSVREYIQEVQHRASHQDTSDAISGHSSKPQEVSNCCLGLVGERMLQDWFQPERYSVWSEAKVNAKLHNLILVPEQQSAVDSGIHLDQ